MEVSGQLHAPTALIPGEIWYPLDRRRCGPQSRSECRGVDEKSLPCSCWVSNLGRTAHSLVTILTELPRLQQY